jgi:ubiquitin-conjugating enzyme E2 O
LLSAFIIGPPDSFFEDFPFLFDILLPPAYPAEPPSLFFVSYVAERFHPHLYADGKVCMSLLGTWPAQSPCERWNPSSSSLTQVLLSIQGLFLSTRFPYFLEPGFEKQQGTPRGEALAHLYNERSLVLLCRSLSRLLIAPPPLLFSLVSVTYLQNSLPRILRRLQDTLTLPQWSQGSKIVLSQLVHHIETTVRSRQLLPEPSSQ